MQQCCRISISCVGPGLKTLICVLKRFATDYIGTIVIDDADKCIWIMEIIIFKVPFYHGVNL